MRLSRIQYKNSKERVEILRFVRQHRMGSSRKGNRDPTKQKKKFFSRGMPKIEKKRTDFQGYVKWGISGNSRPATGKSTGNLKG